VKRPRFYGYRSYKGSVRHALKLILQSDGMCSYFLSVEPGAFSVYQELASRSEQSVHFIDGKSLVGFNEFSKILVC
jgi:hypothetical protein